MQNRVIGVTGLMLTVIGLLAFVGIWATRADWIDRDGARFGAMGVCLVGFVLGWASFKTAEGKAAAVIGTLLLIICMYALVRTS